eukprot:scaffold22264_cov62-Phaeocystis_antarctica.AAC.6
MPRSVCETSSVPPGFRAAATTPKNGSTAARSYNTSDAITRSNSAPVIQLGSAAQSSARTAGAPSPSPRKRALRSRSSSTARLES